MLYENKCYETCKTGKNEKCKTCNPFFEYRLYCVVEACNYHFYLYNGIKSTEFKYCNTSKYCNFDKNVNI